MAGARVRQLSSDLRTGPLGPIFGLWSLGGILGVPTLFLAIGFLVSRGHTSLFALPSSLLQASPQQLVLYGGQWALATLRVLLHWSVLLVVLALLAFQLWTSRRVRPLPGSRWASVAALAGLIALSASAVRQEINLLAYQSDLLLQPGARTPDVLKLLLESPSGAETRDWLYRAISGIGMVVASSIPWLLRARAVGPPAMRWPLQVAQFVALVLALTALLIWPMCFGRLQIDYSRPMVHVLASPDGTRASIAGVILNPQGDPWTILTCSPTGCIVRHSEVKSLGAFEIGKQVDVFGYAATQALRPTPARP